MSTAGTIRLAYSGVSLTFEADRYLSAGQPRSDLFLHNYDFSNTGNLVEDGRSFQYSDGSPFRRQVWNFSVALYDTEWETLDDLWNLQYTTRPTPEIKLHDYTSYMKEATRTRALATGASASTVNGLVRYYGQFNTVFIQRPTFERNRGIYSATLQLQESSLTTP